MGLRLGGLDKDKPTEVPLFNIEALLVGIPQSIDAFIKRLSRNRREVVKLKTP